MPGAGRRNTHGPVASLGEKRVLRTIGGVLLGWAIACSTARAENWLEIRTRHFTVVSDASDKDARRVAQQFERIRSLIGSVSHLSLDPGRPIAILAVRNEAGLKSLLPGLWEAKGGARATGVFVRGFDRHSIALRTDVSGPAPYSVIYHEYAHLLAEVNFRFLPLWLQEGLAEFYAGTEVDATDVRWGRLADRHRRVLQRRKWVPLEALLTANPDSAYYREAKWAPSFYAQAAVLTHYLLLGPEQARRRFDSLRRLLEEGDSNEEEATRLFGDLGTLEKALQSYVKGNTFSSFGARLSLGDPDELAARVLTPAEALTARGEFLVETGRPVEARPLLERALAMDPSLVRAHVALGRAHLQLRQRDEAGRVLGDALAMAPESPLLHYWAAAALPGSRDAHTIASKEEHLRRAIGLDPAFAQARRDLAKLYLAQDLKLDEALVQARKACELEPRWWPASVTLAELLRKAGQSGPAQAAEQDLRRRALADPSLLVSLSYFFDRTGRPEESEAALREARARRPEDLETLAALGGWLDRQHRHDEAESVYREALAVHPGTARILNNLGYMNAVRGVRLEEALKLIERALEKEPTNRDCLDSRGWALFLLGRLREAEEVLRKSLSRGEDPVIVDHLGDVLRERGALEEALGLWRRALAGGDAEPELQRALEAKIHAAENELARPR